MLLALVLNVKNLILNITVVTDRRTTQRQSLCCSLFMTVLPSSAVYTLCCLFLKREGTGWGSKRTGRDKKGPYFET